MKIDRGVPIFSCTKKDCAELVKLSKLMNSNIIGLNNKYVANHQVKLPEWAWYNWHNINNKYLTMPDYERYANDVGDRKFVIDGLPFFSQIRYTLAVFLDRRYDDE